MPTNPYQDIEAKLKVIQRELREIKKRAQGAVSAGVAKKDQKHVAAMRKKLGLK